MLLRLQKHRQCDGRIEQSTHNPQTWWMTSCILPQGLQNDLSRRLGRTVGKPETIQKTGLWEV